MEYIFKSDRSLKVIEKVREFILSEQWMWILFCIAAIFACLHSYFPDEKFQIWGTVVLAYITGFCFLFSGDIFAMLIPTLFTYLIAMRCYNSLEDFMSIAWLLVPLIAIILFILEFIISSPFCPRHVRGRFSIQRVAPISLATSASSPIEAWLCANLSSLSSG